MNPEKPVSPEEQWRRIAAFADGAHEEDLGDEPDESVRAALADLGADPDDIGRQGEDFVAQALADAERAEASAPKVTEPVLAGDAVGPEVTPLSSRRTRRAVWTIQLLAAAIVLALAVTTVVSIARRDPTPPIGPDLPGPSPTPKRPVVPPEQVAANTRSDAAEACRLHHWGVCVSRLDEAATLDPAGDRAPEVQALRAAAAAGQKAEDDEALKEERKKGK